MPFVSITRLRLRSAWYLLPFMVHTTRSANQLVRNSRFIKGKTLLDKHLTFWTMTLWNSEADMRTYRNADAHKKAMPKLQIWCDEASIVHWQQDSEEYPEWQSAWEHLISGGRASKVKHPTAAHATLEFPSPRYSSRTERILLPKK
ncbi:MAG: hypothetical protein ACJ75B_21765 [Flavisolibacter sp.]